MSERTDHWFNCPCGHEVKLWLHHIVSRNDESLSCSYCCYPPKALCNNDDCELCFNNSLASVPKIAKNWSAKNSHSPRMYFKTTPRQRCWITCDNDICGHDFNSAIWDLTKPKSCWCPYCCTNAKKVCMNVDCNYCYDRSFASHQKLEYWSFNNVIMPRSVYLRTTHEYEFFCEKGHVFTMSPSDVLNNKWCPICYPGRATTGNMLNIHLKKMFPDVKREKTYIWCKNPETNYKLRFDFYIPSKNVLIELDGLQHFKQCVPKWLPPDVQRARDIFKMEKALENGFRIIRIYQPDVWYNKNYWWLYLHAAIESDVETFYIGPPMLYDAHKKDM